MKLHHVAFVCCLSALMDANTGITIHQKKEGTHFKIQWQFKSSPESPKFLCRNECEDGDVLVNTTENRAENGSRSIEYRNSSSAAGVLHVIVANLSKSDSGRYRCGVGSSSRDFEVRVVEAREEEINIHTGDEGGTASVACYFTAANSTKFFCRGQCEYGTILINTTEARAGLGRYSVTYGPVSDRNSFCLRVTITDLNRADSGRYTCGLGESLSSGSFQKFKICITDNASKSGCIGPDPTTSTSTRGLRSDAESPPTKTTSRFTALLLTLMICVPVVVVLLVVGLLSLHRLREAKTPRSRNKDVTLLAVTYENDICSQSHSDGQSINGEAATL